MIRAVFFDLDGTFADTASDLAYALNGMRMARGLAPLPIEATRSLTSLGARGMLAVGFEIAPGHSDYAAMREEFLRNYGVYVGDDRRDVEAGRAAGMKTVAVTYGYLNGGDPETWGADAVIDAPRELLEHL